MDDRHSGARARLSDGPSTQRRSVRLPPEESQPVKRYPPRPPAHPGGHRSPNRDRVAQARFRRAVLARDGGACVECGSTVDVRACHLTPVRDGGSYDVSNGVTRCKYHDQATDPYAR